MAHLRQGRARAWATETLTTIGEACRAVLRETLGKTISWALERATLDGWQPTRIKAHWHSANFAKVQIEHAVQPLFERYVKGKNPRSLNDSDPEGFGLFRGSRLTWKAWGTSSTKGVEDAT
jgi:hypothetical protein